MNIDQGAAAPAGFAKSTPKRSYELMRIVIESLRERPILVEAAAKAGIHRKTLEYWLRCSKAGHDGYDIVREGIMLRFHEHCASAIGEAEDRIHAAAWDFTMGRMIYETDKNGNRVIWGIRGPYTKMHGKMLRFLLEWGRPEEFGKRRKVDVPHKGGVIFLGATTKKPANCSAASIKARKWKAGLRMIREAKA
jgi:hypothetical protein